MIKLGAIIYIISKSILHIMRKGYYYYPRIRLLFTNPEVITDKVKMILIVIRKFLNSNGQWTDLKNYIDYVNENWPNFCIEGAIPSFMIIPRFFFALFLTLISVLVWLIFVLLPMLEIYITTTLYSVMLHKVNVRFRLWRLRRYQYKSWFIGWCDINRVHSLLVKKFGFPSDWKKFIQILNKIKDIIFKYFKDM